MEAVSEKERIIRLVKNLGIVLLIGVGYVLFTTATGIYIPCMFKSITKLYCPGCGVTRMCIALLKLDFHQAFRYNPGVFVISPVLFFYLLKRMIKYVKGKVHKETKAEYLMWIILLIILGIYAILRNIPAFSYLSPTII